MTALQTQIAEAELHPSAPRADVLEPLTAELTLQQPWNYLLVPLIVLGGSGAALIAGGWLLHDFPQQALWILSLALVVALGAFAACVSLRYRLRWARPVAALTTLLIEIRKGHLPIESLRNEPPHLQLLAGEIRLLLQELRHEKQAASELQMSIQHRLDRQTDQLQRQMGTLRRAAMHDPLTGLYNRRIFDAYLPRIVDQAVADKTELCLLLLSVENFQNFKVELGHEAGDDLLRNIGQIIRSTIDANQPAFRNEGEEFVILLPGATADNTRRVADRLRSLVQELAAAHRTSPRVELAVGIALLSESPQPTVAALFRRATEELHRRAAINPATALRKPA